MALVITGILFCLGMVFRNSKTIYTIEFVWMWILLSFCNNTNRPDFMNYLHGYNRYSSGNDIVVKNSEVGYKVLCKLLNELGLNFNQALMVMIFIVLFLLSISIKKYTESIAMVSSLFMLYPLFMHGIQVRNAIAMSIIVFGFRYLFEEKKTSLIKYGVCVIVAVLFHSTAIIYFLLILTKLINKKNLKYWVMIFVCLVAVASRIDLSILRSIFGGERYEAKFFIGNNTILETALMILWQLAGTILLILLYFRVKNTEEYLNSCHLIQAINENIIRINMILLAILPLYYLDASTERLYRNILVLNFVLVANCIQITGIKREINFVIHYVGLVGWYLFSFVCYEVVYHNRWEYFLKGYFMENDMILHWENHILLWLFLVGIVVSKVILEKKKVHFVSYKKKNLLRE